MLCLVLVPPSCNWSAFIDADCGRYDGRPKCEGGKSVAELRPEVIETAAKLNDGRSLRQIAAGLAEQGFVTPAGKHYSATSIKRMLGEGGSKSRALTHHDAKGRRLLWPE
jgi:hypothetical protein